MDQMGQTMRQHLIALADAVGVASFDENGAVALPDDEYELGKLKTKYNEGLTLMAMSKTNGWYALNPVVPVKLTTNTTSSEIIEGDISRYRLPAWVSGQPLGQWTWTLDNGSMAGRCTSRAWGDITNMLAMNRGGGIPRFVACMPQDERLSDNSTRKTWQIRVAPKPNQAYTLSAKFRRSIVTMSELGDRHAFGALHDLTVLAAAKWAYMKDETDPRRDQYRIDFLGSDGTGNTDGLLFQSKELDNQGSEMHIASLLDCVEPQDTFQMTPPISIINGATYQ